MKPKPIMTILTMFFSRMLLKYNNAIPIQRISTISIGGVLSLNPVINPISIGIVTACSVSNAVQPMPSIVTLRMLALNSSHSRLKRILAVSTILPMMLLSSLVLRSLFIENMCSDLGYLLFTPIWTYIVSMIVQRFM